MRCPFLREAQVKYCQAAPFKKMILRTPEHDIAERCSSPEYVHCPSAKHRHEELPSRTHCPFLHESLVQYCSAASVTKFIPYSESVLSRCGNESHRYCDLYLALENPRRSSATAAPGTGTDTSIEDRVVDGIRVPPQLSYSANHMWLDVNGDGHCHVGVDALLARTLGSVEKLAFGAIRGISRPAAILTVGGADLEMVFPNRMLLTRPNSYLRASPEKLLSDPYGVGWLFEGEPASPDPAGRASLADGLIPGKSALTWMVEEVQRIAAFIHGRLGRAGPLEENLLPDGGAIAHGLVRYMSRDEIMNLFDEFFSPYAGWGR